MFINDAYVVMVTLAGAPWSVTAWLARCAAHLACVWSTLISYYTPTCSRMANSHEHCSFQHLDQLRAGAANSHLWRREPKSEIYRPHRNTIAAYCYRCFWSSVVSVCLSVCLSKPWRCAVRVILALVEETILFQRGSVNIRKGWGVCS